MICGHARVSTDGQSVEAQVDRLTAAGAVEVFRETASGAKADRAQLAAGDVPMVTRVDRLARSTRDLLDILAQLTEAGTGFRFSSDTWADTTTTHGRLMLTILGGLAEFVGELIRARTGEASARYSFSLIALVRHAVDHKNLAGCRAVHDSRNNSHQLAGAPQVENPKP